MVVNDNFVTEALGTIKPAKEECPPSTTTAVDRSGAELVGACNFAVARVYIVVERPSGIAFGVVVGAVV